MNWFLRLFVGSALVAGVILGALLLIFPMGTLRAYTPHLSPVAKASHRVALQVNTRDPETMNLALNNANNVEQYFKARGEQVQIEIVTFGPGLHMLREDTSPVKDRIKAMTSSGISFMACDNTRSRMAKTEGHEIPLLMEATVVSSGAARLVELQEKGWSYVRP